jgi:hypothetical protein
MSNESYTEDLGKFGARERAMAAELLSHPLPDTFADDNVRIGFNLNSGNVFLVNDDYQTAMMNGDDLQVFHSTPYSGLEGFIEDLLADNDPSDLHNDDEQYIRDAAEAEGVTLPANWMQP